MEKFRGPKPIDNKRKIYVYKYRINIFISVKEKQDFLWEKEDFDFLKRTKQRWKVQLQLLNGIKLMEYTSFNNNN